MLVEEFEQIASAAPETVTLEFVDGRIEEKRGADGSHGTVIMWLLRQCLQSRPDLNLVPGRGSRSGRTATDAPARMGCSLQWGTSWGTASGRTLTVS